MRRGQQSEVRLSPWERFEGLVVCSNFGGMQITDQA